MNSLTSNAMFGIILSFAAFEIGMYIYKKTRFALFNPLLIAIIIVSAFLLIFKIDYSSYNQGGQFINFFVTPATVVLALPLYRTFNVLKKNIVPIISGIVLGALVSISSIVISCHYIGIKPNLVASLAPKSVTTAIAIDISKQLGGVQAITVAVVIITGVIGAVIGPTILKLARIEDALAQGVAMGTSAHAVGTSKAIELGETQGAMSGLAIGVGGLVTVFLAPICIHLFALIFK